jgi:UDP-glucose 4-epimerase
MKTKVLISGVAGFIGSNVAKSLCKNSKYSILGIDNLSSGKIKNIPKNKNLIFLKLDISKDNCLDNLNFSPDYILHFAGQSSGEKSYYDPILDLKNNTISTLNLIKYGIKKKTKKIIYASSMSIYGNPKKIKCSEKNLHDPISCYGISKSASENYLKIYSNKLPYTILRFFNIYGIGQDLNNYQQGMLSIYIAQAVFKKKIIVKGSENRIRDFVNIDYVKMHIEKIIKLRKFDNQILNFGTGKKISVKKVLNIISKETNVKKIIIKKKGTPFDQYQVVADIKKLKKFKIAIKDNLKENIIKFIKFAKNVRD